MPARQLRRYGSVRQRQLSVSVVPLGVCRYQGGAIGRLALSRVQESGAFKDQESTLGTALRQIYAGIEGSRFGT